MGIRNKDKWEAGASKRAGGRWEQWKQVQELWNAIKLYRRYT